MPWAALIGGSSGDPGAQYRDPALREACVNDPLSYHGRMRIATAGALLKLRCGCNGCDALFAALTFCAPASIRSEDLEASLPDVKVPFLALHGTADSVVDIRSSRLLVERAASEDMRLREVPGALHSLLCELPDVRADVLHYVTEWLEPRAAKAAAKARAQEDRPSPAKAAAQPRTEE